MPRTEFCSLCLRSGRHERSRECYDLRKTLCISVPLSLYTELKWVTNDALLVPVELSQLNQRSLLISQRLLFVTCLWCICVGRRYDEIKSGCIRPCTMELTRCCVEDLFVQLLCTGWIRLCSCFCFCQKRFGCGRHIVVS